MNSSWFTPLRNAHGATQRINYWKTIPDLHTARLGTDELGNCGKNGRSASGGKIFNGRTENGNCDGRNCLNESQHRGNRDINGRSVNLAMREKSDGALMLGAAGVGVKPFVQRRRGGHRVEQQDNPGQQRGNDYLAVRLEMAFYEPHNTWKLADIMPGARGFQIPTSAAPRTPAESPS